MDESSSQQHDMSQALADLALSACMAGLAESSLGAEELREALAQEDKAAARASIEDFQRRSAEGFELTCVLRPNDPEEGEVIFGGASLSHPELTFKKFPWMVPEVRQETGLVKKEDVLVDYAASEPALVAEGEGSDCVVVSVYHDPKLQKGRMEAALEGVDLSAYDDDAVAVLSHPDPRFDSNSSSGRTEYSFFHGRCLWMDTRLHWTEWLAKIAERDQKSGQEAAAPSEEAAVTEAAASDTVVDVEEVDVVEEVDEEEHDLPIPVEPWKPLVNSVWGEGRLSVVDDYGKAMAIWEAGGLAVVVDDYFGERVVEWYSGRAFREDRRPEPPLSYRDPRPPRESSRQWARSLLALVAWEIVGYGLGNQVDWARSAEAEGVSPDSGNPSSAERRAIEAVEELRLDEGSGEVAEAPAADNSLDSSGTRRVDGVCELTPSSPEVGFTSRKGFKTDPGSSERAGEGARSKRNTPDYANLNWDSDPPDPKNFESGLVNLVDSGEVRDQVVAEYVANMEAVEARLAAAGRSLGKGSKPEETVASSNDGSVTIRRDRRSGGAYAVSDVKPDDLEPESPAARRKARRIKEASAWHVAVAAARYGRLTRGTPSPPRRRLQEEDLFGDLDETDEVVDESLSGLDSAAPVADGDSRLPPGARSEALSVHDLPKVEPIRPGAAGSSTYSQEQVPPLIQQLAAWGDHLPPADRLPDVERLRRTELPGGAEEWLLVAPWWNLGEEGEEVDYWGAVRAAINRFRSLHGDRIDSLVSDELAEQPRLNAATESALRFVGAIQDYPDLLAVPAGVQCVGQEFVLGQFPLGLVESLSFLISHPNCLAQLDNGARLYCLGVKFLPIDGSSDDLFPYFYRAGNRIRLDVSPLGPKEDSPRISVYGYLPHNLALYNQYLKGVVYDKKGRRPL